MDPVQEPGMTPSSRTQAGTVELMTSRWATSRKDFSTIVGTVTRTVWLDSTGLTAASPFVRVAVVGERELAHFDWRVLRMGAKYRTEWLDGTPVRICDGESTWNFFYHPSDYGYLPGPVVPVKSSKPNSAPFFYDLPPQPVEQAAIEELDALSVEAVDYAGRQVIEVVYPVSQDRPLERGFRYLIDPETGFLIRSSYGDDDVQVVEWRDVRVDLELDDDLFDWTGPVRFEQAS